MAKLITISDLQAIIRKVGILNFFQLLTDELRQDYADWQNFKKIPRIASHFPHGVIELMPIWNDQYYSFKYVNGHPNNPVKNNLTVAAMGVLSDVDSGYPLLVSEMTLLTALRTAATSALAAHYLTNSNPHSMAIIGTGSQSEFLVLAHLVIQNIKHVKYFDIDSKAMKKFSQNLSSFNLNLEPGNDINHTIENADVIITATAAKTKATILTSENVQPGVHISGIGGDTPGKTEIEKRLLENCKIVVEYFEQTALEGEIQNLNDVKIYAELWELVTGRKKGRENNHEITLFDSVGFALEDYSSLKLIYRLSQEFGIGENINLVPQLEDPKNLFTLVL